MIRNVQSSLLVWKAHFLIRQAFPRNFVQEKTPSAEFVKHHYSYLLLVQKTPGILPIF